MKTIELTFDASIFSSDALLATGYWCADVATLGITRKEGSYLLAIKALEGKDLDQPFVDSFNLMVVHNQIRANLKQTFAPLETAIVNHAFRPVNAMATGK